MAVIITAELSPYPLDSGYAPTVRAYIEELQQFESLDIRCHAMTTEIFGEYNLVMRAIETATGIVFEREDATVLVAKLINRDRRV